MKRYIKSSEDTFSQMQMQFEEEQYEDIDPLYEFTEAGQYVSDLDLEVLDSLGYECEPSVQGGTGRVDFWPKGQFEGYEDAITIDFERWNEDIGDDFLESTSKESFINRRTRAYKRILNL